VLLVSGLSAGSYRLSDRLPILRLRDDFLAIATLGFGILVRVLLDNSDRFIEVLGGSRGFVGLPRITNLELTLFTTAFLILITRNAYLFQVAACSGNVSKMMNWPQRFRNRYHPK